MDASTKKERLLLHGGSIVDVVSGSVLPLGTALLVDGTTIEALIHLDGAPPIEAKRVDVSGLWLCPALANTHTHAFLPVPGLPIDLNGARLAKKFAREQVAVALADCIRHGVTNIRDTWTEDLRVSRRFSQRIEKGELLGPRIHQSVLVAPLGSAFAPKRGQVDRFQARAFGLPFVDFEDQSSGVITFSPAASVAQVRAVVDRAIDERGAACIKFYEQREKKITYKPGAILMTQPQLDAAADQARARGVSTTMHHVTAESFRRGVRAGVGSLAHLPIDGVLDTYDLDAFVASQTFLEPTLSLVPFLCHGFADNPYRNHPRQARLGHIRDHAFCERVASRWMPELRESVRRGFDRVAQGNFKAVRIFDMSHVFLYFAGLIGPGMDNVQLLVKRTGISQLGLGNDAGAVPTTPAQIDLELQMLRFCLDEIAPLSAAEQLRIATLGSASAMGIDADFGTLEPGKQADIALYKGNPLDDGSLIGAEVDALFRGGELLVNRAAL